MATLAFYFFCALIAAFSSHLTQTTASRLKISRLPGYEGRLPSNMYRGYMSAGNNKWINYMFVESELDIDSPVILWMQGGPGASGFIGMFTEMGPFRLNVNSFTKDGSVPKLFSNPYSWTKFAHMIFMESPVGVGYSYCDGDCPINNDTTAAEDAHAFLTNFFKEYPEFNNKDFYIIGESYGGVYVPMLGSLLVDKPIQGVNFKGIAVGNGCLGTTESGGCGPDSSVLLFNFLHGHGQISQQLYDKFTKHNCTSNPSSADCKEIFLNGAAEAGTYNQYGLYDDCYGAELDGVKVHSSHDYLCWQDDALETWAKHPDVKYFMEGKQNWAQHDGFWDKYKTTEKAIIPHYQKIFQKKLRVLIYYGDTDTAVNYIGGLTWVPTVATEVLAWHPMNFWEKTLGTVGHITRYDVLDFATIRGAVHMMPRSHPEAAFYFMHKWLKQYEPFDPLSI